VTGEPLLSRRSHLHSVTMQIKSPLNPLDSTITKQP
jgi:hypothetical protein